MKKLKNLDDVSAQIWEEINNLKLQIPALLVRVDEVDVKIPDEMKQLLSYARSIAQLKSKFKDYEDTYNDIVSKMDVVKNSEQTSSEILEEIKQAKESIESISSEANKIKKAIDENSDIVDDIETMNTQLTEVETAHSQIEKYKIDIKNIHKVIFGGTSTNEESGEAFIEKGLKDELDVAYEALKTNIAKIEKDTKERYDTKVYEWEQQYKGLKEQIESLLPGALQAGLAHAYQEKRKSEEKNLEDGYSKFKWTIGLLISTAFIQLTIVVIWLFAGKDLVFVFKNMPTITLGLLPIFAALIWIGVYQNKSLNLTKKLIEEYFHKEASARTFEGLSKQMEELGDSELANELKMKLLNQTLDTAGKNPSDCITNHEKSDNPIFSLMNASSKWVKQFGGAENVAKIFGAISTMYMESSKKDEEK